MDSHRGVDGRPADGCGGGRQKLCGHPVPLRPPSGRSGSGSGRSAVRLQWLCFCEYNYYRLHSQIHTERRGGGEGC